MKNTMEELVKTGKFGKLRHRWEMPMIYLSVFLTLVFAIVALMIISVGKEALDVLFEEDTSRLIDEAGFVWVLLAFPLITLVVRFYMAAQVKANAVRVGPRQFPQIWEMYTRLAKTMELPVYPKLYIKNGDGVMNAFALSCNRKHKYIIVHAEIAMLAEDQPEVLEFVLAHELAHHRLGHVSLWRAVIELIPSFIIPLGATSSRAAEYSADRVAISVCHHHRSAQAALVAGPWLYDKVDHDVWMEQCEDEHKELFIRVANLMSGHAVLTKRAKALRDIDKHGLKIHGEMF